MKIKILKSASRDLIDGYQFYEKQSEGRRKLKSKKATA
jgi:hypothetical protein